MRRMCAAVESVYEFDTTGGWAIFNGRKISPFDLVDALQNTDSKLYLHDLEARTRNRAQLDLVQDLSLEIPIWYDGGIRQAEGVIDPLVAGAEMVALDPTFMKSEEEFDHVLKLTSNVVLDLLTEHEDRIPDYNGAISAGKGLNRVLQMGYSNFIVIPSELPIFDAVAEADDLAVWIRTDDAAQLQSGHKKLKGVVKSIKELVVEDER